MGQSTWSHCSSCLVAPGMNTMIDGLRKEKEGEREGERGGTDGGAKEEISILHSAPKLVTRGVPIIIFNDPWGEFADSKLVDYRQ